MSETDLINRLEDLIQQSLSDSNKKDFKKETIFNLSFLVKAGFTIVMGSLAFAGLSYKIDSALTKIDRVEALQTKGEDRWILERQTMNLQIQTCQTQIAVLNQQIKDLQNTQK